MDQFAAIDGGRAVRKSRPDRLLDLLLPVVQYRKSVVYSAPASLRLNDWALSGDWTVKKELSLLNQPNGRIAYRFHARDLHLVMGPALADPPYGFACSSMDSRDAPLTGLTLTTKATARLPNRGCIS